MGHDTFRAGDLTAVIGDNSAAGDHKSGYNGLPSVAEGQLVSEGDVLVQLDDQVARSHRNKLALSLKNLDEQRQQADIAVELAQLEVRRLQKLIESKTGGIPDAFRAELEKAQLALRERQAPRERRRPTAPRERARAPRPDRHRRPRARSARAGRSRAPRRPEAPRPASAAIV